MAAVAEALALLEALKEQVGAVTEHARGLLRRVRGGQLLTEKGLSLLEVRGAGLLHYVTDLGLLLLAKAEGRSLRELPALSRLLESRVVLEKLRPLELHLRHTLEQLLRGGARGDNDPLTFKPRPLNMATEEEEEEEGAEPGGDRAPGLGGGKRYRPPRLVPRPYAPEQPAGGAGAWQRRRALGSDVIRELREELSEEPLEMGGGAGGETPTRGALHRQRYEEAMLVRLREGRGRKRGGAPRDVTRDITRFNDITPLLEATNQEAPPTKKKKRSKVKKKRGKGFRRRR